MLYTPGAQYSLEDLELKPANLRLQWFNDTNDADNDAYSGCIRTSIRWLTVTESHTNFALKQNKHEYLRKSSQVVA